MPKFFTECSNIADGKIKIVGGDVSHIKRVLRKNIGDTITVCDGNGTDYIAKISSISDSEIISDIISEEKCHAEANTKIYIFQCLPKQGKMEFIIQKNTELGAYKFIPVYSKRCVVKPTDKTARWQKVAFEACKQCGRGIVPNVSDTITFDDALQKISQFQHKIMFYECEDKVFLKDVIKNKIEEIAILIGPEGGFDIEEVLKAKQLGIPTVSLGKRILRTETAALAVTPIILYEQGDV